ncbi:phage virion morphogenesis protein [Neisseria elongata]|uniref:phage virion morphogenesis protein n=1 Tax=Neisseria elongata TaxID=495 RepID=UPI00361E511E
MLEIKLDAERLDHGLSTLLKNATDTRAMMRGIATELLSMAEDNFETESWGGQRWKQSRRAADKGGKTLQKSGQLAASLTTQVGSNYALIGSNKKYAAIHLLGGQAGRGHKTNFPARPYLPINGNNQLQPDAERRILDIAITALKKEL